ncbi:TonB-dependent siderophore receptor [Devosia sp.]|uniref:TonB-dependent receptor plug domain-containing protein n=1 Tax=Devosia sp. TaxID=1871048 RepID=UPI001B1C15BC|nr:TonB-dependent receptor [Devosia sp.]MBO9591009.1 TonB-dependent receptor [Devosia sp.]
MRLKPHVSSLALLTAMLATSLPAAAQETTLDVLRITAAGLTPFEEQEIGRSYTVIDGDKIQLSGTPYVADILRQVPGFAVSRTGSVGSKTQVRVRGAEGNHVLVLIDGVPVSETADGEFDFGRLQVANVERIEILRGPQSAFWGANAMAGVINIVTRSSADSGLHGSLSGEFGSDGTKMTSGSLAYGQDNFNASGSLTLRHTDGFNISSLGSELDGASHIDANARFSAEITPELTLDGTVRYGRMYAQTDWQDFSSIVQDTSDTGKVNELFGSLGLGWVSEDGIWFQNARISAGTTERISTNRFDAVSTAYNGDRYKASYQVGRNFDTPDFLDSTHTVTFGYDLVHETFQRLNSTSITDPSMLELKQRTTHSLIGEYRGTYFDQLYLTAALRHDFNDNFADVTTYSASAAWQIPNTGTKLHGSVGTGSTNPTFYEQFGSVPGSFTPNPNLVPETSFGWDVGVEQSLLDGMVVVDATYFNQTLENEILEDGWAPSTVINQTGTSTRQGVELSASVNIVSGLTAGVTYTYLDAQEPSGKREIRRPQHSAAVNLAYKLEEIPLTLHGEVVFVGNNMDDDFSTWPATAVTLPAYTVVNAGLNYQVSDQVEIYGRVHNLFDTKYQEVFGYNTQGRTFYAGARAKF